MRIPSELLSHLSEAILRLYAPIPIGELPRKFLTVVRGLIDCEHLAYDEFGTGRFSCVHEPVIDAKLNEAFVAYLDQHPSIDYVKRTHSTKAVKISDFITSKTWCDTDLYNQFFRKLNIRHQIAFMFPVGDMQIGFAANRERRDFSEVDRFILDLLVPHLSLSIENARIFAKLQDRMHLVADSSGGGGTIVFDSEGSVLFCSHKAADCIARFFGPIVANRLPDELNRWVKMALGKPTLEGLASGALHPFTKDTEGSSLTVRLLLNHAANEHTLILQENSKTLPFAVFKDFGLTRREVEVLHWITQGKTNPEIAVILDISVKTVGHHIEHIMSKLGVERRGGAALWAQQTLNSRCV